MLDVLSTSLKDDTKLNNYLFTMQVFLIYYQNTLQGP